MNLFAINKRKNFLKRKELGKFLFQLCFLFSLWKGSFIKAQFKNLPKFTLEQCTIPIVQLSLLPHSRTFLHPRKKTRAHYSLFSLCPFPRKPLVCFPHRLVHSEHFPQWSCTASCLVSPPFLSAQGFPLS